MTNKDDLRQKAKRIRNAIDINSISKSIVQNIRNTEIYKSAKNVMIFYPMANEIDLRELLCDDKIFYLPRVEGDNLEVCPYCKNNKLAVSSFNVLEPLSDSVDKSVLDLVIVPALCVDKQCNRLGYGKGFYDRFLKDFLGVSIVVVPSELVFDCVYADKNDIACNRVITQSV